LKESKCDIQFLHVCTFAIEQYNKQNMFFILGNIFLISYII